jgi:paraquat-inducible protein A
MMNLSHPTHQPNHRSRTADPSIKACEVCDAVVELDAAEKGSVLLCPKCLTVMVRHYTHPFETSLSLAIASLIPFSIVLVAPFLTLAVGGTEATSTVVDTAIVLFNKGFPFVGLLVLLMTLVFPLVRMLSLIYVLGPLSIGRVAPGAWFVF